MYYVCTHTNEWFHINKFDFPSGRIALYKHALLLPQQHQPLLDFHLCLLSSKNALIPTSALAAFNVTWPPLIGFTIESFLLPNKQARQTMQQEVLHFNATLNDHGEQEQTQLFRAVLQTDVESVRFLLCQEGISINTFSKLVTRRQGAADIIRWRTPLYLAEQRVTSEATTRRKQVAKLLLDAGGNPHIF